MKSPVRIPGQLDEPERKDTVLGAAVHIVSIFSPLWGPLIGWAIFRGTRKFVAAHAWSALAEFILLKAALLAAGLISFGFTIASLVNHYNNQWKDFSWWPILTKLALTWIALLILGAITTVLSVRQALRAYNGHWPASHVRKARKSQKSLAES